MVKFERVEEWKVMYCEEPTNQHYLRMSSDSWLTLMGQEWYYVSDCSELEAAYHAWVKEHD